VLTALLLSVTVLEGATNPWRGLFAQSKGAQIWMHLAPGTKVPGLPQIAGVTAVAGPYTTTAATIVQGPVESAVELRAMTLVMPQVGRLLVRQGSWLRGAEPDGVVLEASFAQAIHATVGSRLVINGIDGPTARVRVIGIAAVHRVGELAIGDLAVVVAVSCSHRGEAFDACRALIDLLKASVPIWKHQAFADGSSEWVGSP